MILGAVILVFYVLLLAFVFRVRRHVADEVRDRGGHVVPIRRDLTEEPFNLEDRRPLPRKESS